MVGLADKVARPNLHYDLIDPETGINYGCPAMGWRYDQSTMNRLIEERRILWPKSKTGRPRKKQFINDYQEEVTGFSSIIGNDIYTRDGTNALREIFQDNTFDFPKPVELVKELIAQASDQNSIVLDSFAGSGTTAHAVLNLNKQDGGARKFILVEMEDYADTVTAERVKRVIKGYGGKEGTGGSFGFYRLGPPLFAEDGNLNEEAGTDNIRRYVWYTETKTAFTEPPASGNPFFLGMHNDTAYYFFYEPGQVTSLSHDFLSTIKTRAGQYVIYADNCLLTGEFLTLYHIIFKKIPRDVTRF
jgi:adenine-specific DNA-methyltransferase